jgi:hypothetical protein
MPLLQQHRLLVLLCPLASCLSEARSSARFGVGVSLLKAFTATGILQGRTCQLFICLGWPSSLVSEQAGSCRVTNDKTLHVYLQHMKGAAGVERVLSTRCHQQGWHATAQMHMAQEGPMCMVTCTHDSSITAR